MIVDESALAVMSSKIVAAGTKWHGWIPPVHGSCPAPETLDRISYEPHLFPLVGDDDRSDIFSRTYLLGLPWRLSVSNRREETITIWEFNVGVVGSCWDMRLFFLGLDGRQRHSQIDRSQVNIEGLRSGTKQGPSYRSTFRFQFRISLHNSINYHTIGLCDFPNEKVMEGELSNPCPHCRWDS